MKATASLLVITAALLTAACAEGRAIINVDVHSFMDAGADTLRYPPLPAPFIPGGTSVTAGSDTIRVLLPAGFGSSIAESTHVFAIVDLDNVIGNGNTTVDVFISDSASTIFSGTPAFSFGGAVSPATVTTDTVDVDLLSTFNGLFTGSEVWIAFRAAVSATTDVQGTVRLRRLDLRVVIQDHVL